MNPEVFLILKQFIFNKQVVVTDIASFIDENTTNRFFTIDDYFYYFKALFILQFFYLLFFCIHHAYNFITNCILNQLFQFLKLSSHKNRLK